MTGHMTSYDKVEIGPIFETYNCNLTPKYRHRDRPNIYQMPAVIHGVKEIMNIEVSNH